MTSYTRLSSGTNASSALLNEDNGGHPQRDIASKIPQMEKESDSLVGIQADCDYEEKAEEIQNGSLGLHELVSDSHESQDWHQKPDIVDKSRSINSSHKSRKKKIAMSFADITNSQSTVTFWFDIPARAFQFCRTKKAWRNLGTGRAEFYWDAESEKIRTIFKTSNHCYLDYLVDSKIQIGENVAHQQSWVFRAQRRANVGVNDVLCFQFTSKIISEHFCAKFKTKQKHQGLMGKRNEKTGSKNDLQKEIMDTDTLACGRRRVTGISDSVETQSVDSPLKNDRKKSFQRKTIDLELGQVGSWPSSRNQKLKNPEGQRYEGVKVLGYSGLCRKGYSYCHPKKKNQDSVIMSHLPFDSFSNGELMLACFDGHGDYGHFVSQHLSRTLPQLVSTSPQFVVDEYTNEAISDSLLLAEDTLVNNDRINTSLSGSTAVVCVLRGNNLFVANVGDSRVIKGKIDPSCNGIVAEDLSKDHKPDDKTEIERITAAGGRVFSMKYGDGKDGPARVWLPYANYPGLAMSRSICDTVGKEAGIVSTPELYCHKISSEIDKFIVVATDGLWEFMSSQEVVDIVAHFMNDVDPQGAVEKLVEESNRRWMLEESAIDDTSIIVAYFG